MKIKYDANGLVPAIIQDAKTKTVLMLGYMNEEAYLKTNETKKVTFYSRSKKRLWTKGEESGNFLNLVAIKNDCWGDTNEQSFGFLSELEQTIEDRKRNQDNDDSYVASLFRKGINKIAQKVGEEAVEVVIEAKDDDEGLFLNESADLLFHYLILLKAKGYGLNDIEQVLLKRKK